jgi:hypothetical protein
MLRSDFVDTHGAFPKLVSQKDDTAPVVVCVYELHAGQSSLGDYCLTFRDLLSLDSCGHGTPKIGVKSL